MPDDVKEDDAHYKLKADFEAALKGHEFDPFIAVFIGSVSLIGEVTLYVPPVVADLCESVLLQYEAFACDAPELDDLVPGAMLVGQRGAFLDYFR